MVLEGTAPDDERPERVVRQRITWIPSADGTVVRQHWETRRRRHLGDGVRRPLSAHPGRARRRVTHHRCATTGYLQRYPASMTTSSSGRRGAALVRRRAREREILDATRALFDARGVRDAQIEDVARAVGVNRAIIYRHFSGKEELFALTLVGYLEDLEARLGGREHPDRTEEAGQGTHRGLRRLRPGAPGVRRLRADPDAAPRPGAARGDLRERAVPPRPRHRLVPAPRHRRARGRRRQRRLRDRRRAPARQHPLRQRPRRAPARPGRDAGQGGGARRTRRRAGLPRPGEGLPRRQRARPDHRD